MGRKALVDLVRFALLLGFRFDLYGFLFEINLFPTPWVKTSRFEAHSVNTRQASRAHPYVLSLPIANLFCMFIVHVYPSVRMLAVLFHVSNVCKFWSQLRINVQSQAKRTAQYPVLSNARSIRFDVRFFIHWPFGRISRCPSVALNATSCLGWLILPYTDSHICFSFMP